ncbi:helix-turn-helix domain-containing protein [Natrarchaeobius chitinivorans]|uniref:Bacterio-opsin activator n=1 Tax=Natrarchaeobius chitinivorans TaxID=1679083 RepID=A0A3N6M9G1_NATCH|nr:helix-turn-helix domain-containing protein [Natrarchaeobius chitinivorans]RQG97284.1 bacterio-opsin activator [Natrarchaeobius chitinivorans]
MAIVIEVRFAHENGALVDTLGAIPGLTVRTVPETSTVPGRNVYFFRFGDVTTEELEPVLENDHTVEKAKQVPAVADERMWGIEFTPETELLAPEVTEEGGFVLDARSSAANRYPRGWCERWFVPAEDGVHRIWNHAREAGFEFEVLDLHQRFGADATGGGPEPLTDRQRVALVTAYEHGYFSEPRETSLEELAESLGLSPSAVNGRIRRGLRSLIEATLVVDGSGDRSVLDEHNATTYRDRYGSVSVQIRTDQEYG